MNVVSTAGVTGRFTKVDDLFRSDCQTVFSNIEVTSPFTFLVFIEQVEVVKSSGSDRQ